MLRVFVTLVGSLITAPIVGTDFFHSYLYEIDYLLYLTARSSVYILFACVGLILARQEKSRGRSFSSLLILALCFCMAVTGLFNLVMVNHDVYNFLNEFKSGDGFSWRNIYLSVEVMIAFIVGGNVLNYIAHMDVCPHGGDRGIIRDSNDTYTG